MKICVTKKNLEKSTASQLAIKMTVSLVLAIIVGTSFLLLREYLNSHNKEHIWNIINNLLFQDISVPEGKNSLGLFYILGQLFINCLQLVIIPMVFTSISLAMCHISDTKKLGRISSKTLLGFLTTSIFALITGGVIGFIAYKLGMFNVNLSNSGLSSSPQANSGNNPLLVIISAVPNNMTSVLTTNTSVLAIVFLAVVIGLCINQLNDKMLVLKNLLQDINNIITVFLNFVIIKFTPIAVFILITRTLAIYGINYLKPALAYMLIVFISSSLFLIFGYPLFIFIKTGLNPFVFMKKVSKVSLLGFSAASSAAAVSLNQKTAINELGISSDIASFTIPLGMTINMNGTAIMQLIGTIFIASSAGYDITVLNIIIIAILALIASVGTPSAPGSSCIILFTVLSGMGYNNEASLVAYSLLLAINRPMDMFTTCLNVTGDSATALVVAKSENCLDEEVYYS